MAKKAARKSTRPPKGGAAEKEIDKEKLILESALRLAAAQGWRDLSLSDIAVEAKMPMAELYAHYPSKQSILKGFSRMIDRQVLLGEEGGDEEESREPARDRLFDVIMRRFDALAPYRDGVSRILAALSCDPLMALCSTGQLRRSMAAMLEAADLSAAGCRGVVRVKALSAVYLATLRVWLRDDSEDMAKTMAALDRNLTKLDRAVRRSGFPRRAEG